MPDPPPEALRALALTALDSAAKLRWSAHFLEFLSKRPEPQLPQALLEQRRTLLVINAALLEKEFTEQMDKLVECWANFREAQANVPG